MKAIILSAGQGSRLLPLTETMPKCLLPVGDKPLLARQFDALYGCGIKEIAIVTGFGSAAVDHCLRSNAKKDLALRSVFNPFFNVADNLASCWMARHEMDKDFILLNGDTLFEAAVCERLLDAPDAAVTLATDHKVRYDSDDMKVRLDGTRLIEVGKNLEPENVDGESIGMIRFKHDGPALFVAVLEQIMRTPNSLSWWFLRAIGILAERGIVETRSVDGLRWCEVDFPQDLEVARSLFAVTARSREPHRSDPQIKLVS